MYTVIGGGTTSSFANYCLQYQTRQFPYEVICWERDWSLDFRRMKYFSMIQSLPYITVHIFLTVYFLGGGGLSLDPLGKDTSCKPFLPLFWELSPPLPPPTQFPPKIHISKQKESDFLPQISRVQKCPQMFHIILTLLAVLFCGLGGWNLIYYLKHKR